jgi:RNA polymerase sigma factor (sigma-70 family)
LRYNSIMDEVTRTSLLLRVRKSGDEEAWDDFCGVYQPLIRRYVTRFKVPVEDADDLVQEIFLKLREQMPVFDLTPAKGRFRAWLRTCTDNRVRDWLRADSRRKAATAPVSVEDLGRSFAEESEADATRQIEWRRAVLELVIGRARAEFQGRDSTWQCFQMSTLENRPAREVAERLGIENVNNVYVYAHRVLQRVKALCAEYDEEMDEGGDASNWTA